MIDNLHLRPRRQRSRWGRRLLLASVVLLGLTIVGYVAGKSWIESYLRSPEFLRFVNARVGKTLQSDVGFQPLQFNGLSVYSEGMNAKGFEGSPFASAQLGQVRAEFSLRRFFEKVWQVDSIEIRRLNVQLDGTRLSRPGETQKLEKVARDNSSSWLPNRVEVAAATINDFGMSWGDLPSTAGALKNVELHVTPADGGWQFEGRNGEVSTAGLPTLSVSSLRLRQREGALFINTADFLAQGGGSVKATGEVLFADHLDLQARLEGVDLDPFLSHDWRLRLHGKVGGDIRVQSSLPANGPAVISGTLDVKSGHLEALPVLNEIATFTRTQQFRSLVLSRASARFERRGTQLKIEDFLAESDGLTRIEGAFTVNDGVIDGTFQVGVAPSTLQWLPGSQERVFTQTRGGYLWTSMRLTGPVDSPTEDLSPRLIAAAGGAVIEKVESTARDALQLGRDAAKSALDLILPKGR